MKAIERYSGKLYSALDWPVPQPADARNALLILSAMFGLLGTSDPIPEYELMMTDKSPSGESVELYWREVLGRGEFPEQFVAAFPEVRYLYLLLSPPYYEAVEALAKRFESYRINVRGGGTGVSPGRWGEVVKRLLSHGAILPEEVKKTAGELGCELRPDP